MKYLELFENVGYSTMTKTMIEYNKYMTYLEPYVLFKYNLLVNEDDYYPEWDSKPNEEIESIDDIKIIDSAVMKDGSLAFTICDFDPVGEFGNKYFIELGKGEIDDIKVRMESDKYNL